MTIEPKLTPREIEVYKACSGEFSGMTAAQAAALFHLSKQSVNGVLRKIKLVCPELFPLLTKVEADTYAMYERAGEPVKDIATKIGVSESRVYQIIASLQKKGRLMPAAPIGRIGSYDNSMDDKITRRF